MTSSTQTVHLLRDRDRNITAVGASYEDMGAAGCSRMAASQKNQPLLLI